MSVTTEPLYYCEPRWHGGQNVPAQYLVKLHSKPARDRTVAQYRYTDRGVCEEHIPYGYRELNPQKDEFVTIREL